MLRASWQVLDEDMRLSELVEEGRVDLPRVAREAGVVLVGVPEWSTSEVGGVLWLHAHVSARVVRSHRAASAEAAAVARAGGSLVVRPVVLCRGLCCSCGVVGVVYSVSGEAQFGVAAPVSGGRRVVARCVLGSVWVCAWAGPFPLSPCPGCGMVCAAGVSELSGVVWLRWWREPA